MSEYTEKVAKNYDKLLYPILDKIRKKTVEIAKKFEAKKIADLCCGTGNQLKYFKKEGFKDIIGVDLSEEMTSMAKVGNNKVNCIVEDAANTSLESDYYDLVNISFALHEKNFETQQGIIKEAKRILKNGGYLVITDYNFGKGAFFLGKIGSTFVEALVGGEHYANFKYYKQHGGMDYLLPDNQPVYKVSFIMGSVETRAYKILK